MASKQETIAAAIQTLVVAAGVDPCFIGSGSHVIQDKYPYGQIFIRWGRFGPDAFLVVDQSYLLRVRVIDETQDLAAEKAEAVLPALLNAAGRTALFTAGVNNIVPATTDVDGESINIPAGKFHRDVMCRITVRHLLGS